MRLVLTGVVFCLAALGSSTDEVLSKLDKAASSFKSMSGNISQSNYTKVLDETTTETGQISLKKVGPKELSVLINFVTPNPRMVAFGGRKAEIYYPKLKSVQEYDLGKRSDLLDQFLLVGFGTTGKDLKANYNVKFLGDESIAGQKTHKLELTPGAGPRIEKLQKLELWVAAEGAYPVQQKFIQQSGDYYLITYTDVQLNPQLGNEAFKLNLPKGVKREFPGK
ncbi:MAG TPA: outer membrane lipoprotein-sorting protein [Bryobacteraceae bacterium]|nr:outer membrane lipoprotein-sorting protein [Bryobacteraceae bacterium]